MPKRIQRKRTAGWKMPKTCVYVGRPSKWGNPFTMVETELSIALYRDMCLDVWGPNKVAHLPSHEQIFIRLAADSWRARWDWSYVPNAIQKLLAGKDLACWCPLDAKCHADVLLEIANR